jgi:hypothetical protein
MSLDPQIGQRVTLRVVDLEGARGVLGHLVDANDQTWTVRRRDGELVAVERSTVVAARIVPPIARRRRPHDPLCPVGHVTTWSMVADDGGINAGTLCVDDDPAAGAMRLRCLVACDRATAEQLLAVLGSRAHAGALIVDDSARLNDGGRAALPAHLT